MQWRTGCQVARARAINFLGTKNVPRSVNADAISIGPNRLSTRRPMLRLLFEFLSAVSMRTHIIHRAAAALW